MATLLEDEDLIAQAQERERLRLEEEARLIAEQQAFVAAQATLPPIPQGNYMNQRQGEIDAIQTQFNELAQGRGLPATRTTDSQEYLDEVARAQRNSGFINANVSDFGEVISPGYDPERDPRAIVARQEATNLQRNQYINSLEQGGATYAEALRAGLGKFPRKGDENLRLKIEQLASQQNFTPRRVTSNGVAYDELKRGIYSRAPVVTEKFIGGKASEATKVAADNIADQITSLRRQIEPGPSGILLRDSDEVAAIKAEIARKERERVALFETPESNPNVHQPGWLAIRDRFNAPSNAPYPGTAPQVSIPVAPTAATPAQAKAVNEIVRMTRDGKRAVYDAETKEFIRYL